MGTTSGLHLIYGWLIWGYKNWYVAKGIVGTYMCIDIKDMTGTNRISLQSIVSTVSNNSWIIIYFSNFWLLCWFSFTGSCSFNSSGFGSPEVRWCLSRTCIKAFSLSLCLSVCVFYLHVCLLVKKKQQQKSKNNRSCMYVLLCLCCENAVCCWTFYAHYKLTFIHSCVQTVFFYWIFCLNWLCNLGFCLCWFVLQITCAFFACTCSRNWWHLLWPLR
jgi:hypothetical protein